MHMLNAVSSSVRCCKSVFFRNSGSRRVKSISTRPTGGRGKFVLLIWLFEARLYGKECLFQRKRQTHYAKNPPSTVRLRWVGGKEWQARK